MITRKRTRIAGAILASAAIITATALFILPGASAGRPGVLDDGEELLPQASLTLDEAIAAAQTAASGPIDEVDLEYWQGTLVFNVDVGDKDVKVNAHTGAVLSTADDD